MKARTAALVLLLAFVLIAVFGLYLPTISHAGHAMRCPFTHGSVEQCVTLFEHAEHWQSAFTAVLTQIVVLLSCIGIIVVFWFLPKLRDPVFERYRQRKRITIRPPLMQELFSQGILHRKEPQMTSFAY